MASINVTSTEKSKEKQFKADDVSNTKQYCIFALNEKHSFDNSPLPTKGNIYPIL